MEDNRILLLRLEGPLQSWGEHSKWDWRDSALMPTKSGLVGLLGCALGIERGNSELQALSASIHVAVRADRPGRLMTDFHTVHADSERGEKIYNALGKPRGDTIVTHRSYLQDASFLAVVQAPDGLWQRLDSALRAPRWPIYLGRKSCIPSCPVYLRCTDSYADLEDAVCREPLAKRAESPILYEIESPDGSGYLRSDETAGADRQFALRRVVQRILQEEATT